MRGGRYLGEVERFLSGEPIWWRNDCIAQPNIEMEGGEAASGEDGFYGEACSSVRRGVEIGDGRANAIDKPIIQVALSGLLQTIVYRDDRISAGVFAEPRRDRYCQIDVFGGARMLCLILAEAQLERIAAFEQPRRICIGKETRQQTLECHLPAQTSKVTLLPK